jgi:hypothetical protein
MINVNYQKRKNLELFKCLEKPETLFLSKTQNYIPIYNKFFTLNDSNYNSINLNNKWYISNVNESDEYDCHLFNCRIKNLVNNKSKDKEVFFKMAPLLDPFKYLIGKYDVLDEKLFTLPKINSTELDCHSKIIDQNNSAYVDGMFAFLSSNLIHSHGFTHGVDYYGSFLGIKNNFILNVFDDIDYLNGSEFFNKNKNVLFKIENYEHLFQDENEKLKPIKIQYNSSIKSQISIKSFDNEIFEDVFNENIINISDLPSDLIDLTNINMLEDKESNQSVTLRSNSTCSSRTSYTEDGEEHDDCDDCGKIENLDTNNLENDLENGEENEDEDDEENEDEDEDDEDDEDDEEKIDVTIPKFPVQVIGMEFCENTFDDLILNSDLSKDEWYSAFMQIIMILITYQKAFNFTHNDLHTNNVMYNDTDKKFIYYCYKKKYYKVPTFGRIFKIIDFGRSIYKFDGKLFCSDSFHLGGDAATQYNTEPYLNEKKPRLEPNYSFDLCRLACSIFDYVVEDFDEIKDLSKCSDPVKRLIVEWCLDDKGVNMLYKGNGVDRYPDFKLYKMIARCVHNHTPQAQLERPDFNAYSDFKGEVPADVIDIDKIPSYI